MKLIEQTILWNNDGNSDKVYEVDLCETGTNQYVVNFRYGRRGSTLKDGTKTTLPIDQINAKKVFDNLVNEKKKGGYQVTSHTLGNQTTTNTPVAKPATPKPDYGITKKEFMVACLREATTSGWNQKKWPLSRIIWRAGELKIEEATPILLQIITRGDALQQYCTCWALGRCGNSQAIPILEQIYKATATKEFVRRQALISILTLQKNDIERKKLTDSILTDLSDFVVKISNKNKNTSSNQSNDGGSGFWKRSGTGNTNKPADDDATALATKIHDAILYEAPGNFERILINTFTPLLGKTISYSILEPLYWLADDYPKLRPLILHFLKEIPFQPNAFKTIRHIFKIAEFREDTEVFALLAYRIEKSASYFRSSKYGYGVYDKDWNWIQKPVEELKKADSKLAYSQLTQQFFTKRIWRTLRTLGEDGQAETYTKLACDILLQYTDAQDQGQAKEYTKTFWSYNSRTRRYDSTTRSIHYDTFARSFTLNHILFTNSPRYELKSNTKVWRCRSNYKPGQSIPEVREEAFPELWDKQPKNLVKLLAKSEALPVHSFAIKALRSQSDLKNLVDFELLMEILDKSYPETVKLGLDLVKSFYNPAQPNLDLIQMLIHHPLQDARNLAKQWIETNPVYFAENTFAFTDLIINPYQDVWEWSRNLMARINWKETTAQALVVRVLSEIINLPADNEMADTAAEGAAHTLISQFLPFLKNLNLDIVTDLLKHPLPNVQMLGGLILIHHNTPAENLPQGLISSLVQSSFPQVRQVGVGLFGKLPETTLINSYDVLSAFCISPFAEIRQSVQPVIRNLAQKNADFGRKLLFELLPYLRQKEVYEGLHDDLFTLFQNALPQFLPEIDKESALFMLNANRTTTQRFGYILIKNYIQATDLSVRQIIQFANHEILDVREHAWQLYNENVARMKYEAEEALRILDSKWDDSRAFAFSFFRKNFTENDWRPELLVSVCDSTREDVQQFGRELITRFFKQENGEMYLLQLSQHPTQTVQSFATNYLTQFATDNLENIEKLESYFITVLSQVNKGGVAKTRIFGFLRNEALKHEKIAQLIADILARQSATMAVADKAHCIKILTELKKKYPTLEMPLKIKEVESITVN
jgi:predicted DNA-binding WGR domain protein